MAYATGNPKTKKQLREMVASERRVSVYNPGLGTAKANGIEHVEGPHYPAAHTWYAQVEVKDGIIVKVIS